MRFLLSLLLLMISAAPACAEDVYFTASDGAQLHYTETGPTNAPALVFVPGWTMPGWIFAPQLAAFGTHYRVILFDPRGQGDSEITTSGYNQDRRGHARPTPTMAEFVVGMFRTRQSAAYLDRLTASCERLPAPYAAELLRYPVPRSYWKEAILSTDVPVLYIVRPHLRGQANNLLIDRPNTTIAVFPKAGHALFVDEPTRFNDLLQHFLDTDVGP
jgi:pimeloyl-ACP methyl ester carboxylesterase